MNSFSLPASPPPFPVFGSLAHSFADLPPAPPPPRHPSRSLCPLSAAQYQPLPCSQQSAAARLTLQSSRLLLGRKDVKRPQDTKSSSLEEHYGGSSFGGRSAWETRGIGEKPSFEGPQALFGFVGSEFSADPTPEINMLASSKMETNPSFDIQQQESFGFLGVIASPTPSPDFSGLPHACSVPETKAGTPGLFSGVKDFRFAAQPLHILEPPRLGSAFPMEGQRKKKKVGFSFRAGLAQSGPPLDGGVPQPVFGSGFSSRQVPVIGFAERSAADSLSQRHPDTLFPAVDLSLNMRKSADPEVLKLKWTDVFQLQKSEGYWELTTELGALINVDVDLFANVFLKSKGIHSLGVRAHADILRLVATLLVLQLMREEKLEEGKLLRTLFRLDDSYEPRPERWEDVKRAVDWVCWADRQYPCVYSRLEFGLSWESSTRQLLGFEGLPPFSSLRDLNLQRTAAPLLVH